MNFSSTDRYNKPSNTKSLSIHKETIDEEVSRTLAKSKNTDPTPIWTAAQTTEGRTGSKPANWTWYTLFGINRSSAVPCTLVGVAYVTNNSKSAVVVWGTNKNPVM